MNGCDETNLVQVLKNLLVHNLYKGTSANTFIPGGDVKDKLLYSLCQAWQLSLFEQDTADLLLSQSWVIWTGSIMTGKSNWRITKVGKMKQNKSTSMKKKLFNNKYGPKVYDLREKSLL